MSPAPWLLACGLSVAGAWLALDTLGASGGPVGWRRAAAVGAVLLVAASLFLGTRRLPQQPRMAALPPRFTTAPSRPGHAPSAPMGGGAPEPARLRPRPRDDSKRPERAPPPRDLPHSFFAYVPAGGLESFSRVGKIWYDQGRLQVELVEARDLCARFKKIPSLCLREEGVPAEIVASLREGAATLHAPVQAGCEGMEGVARFVGDEINDVEETALPPGAKAEIALLEQTVALSATTGADGATTVSLLPAGATEPANVRLTQGDPEPFVLAIAGARLRLRLSPSWIGGVLHVRLHDLHVVCS